MYHHGQLGFTSVVHAFVIAMSLERIRIDILACERSFRTSARISNDFLLFEIAVLFLPNWSYLYPVHNIIFHTKIMVYGYKYDKFGSLSIVMS